MVRPVRVLDYEIGIYARVSTEEQARSGFSLDSQVREGKKKAGTDNVKLYIDDGYSGEFLERPALTQLRRDVREGLIKKIICYDPDRLARKLMLQLIITEEFDKRGAELIFVNGEYAKTPEGTLFYSMRGAVAEFEKAKINQRMSNGRREKAHKGKVVKNDHTYGYKYNKESGSLEIIEEEAAVVRMIFDFVTKPSFDENFVDGEHVSDDDIREEIRGFNGIASYLNRNNIPTKRRKGIWHRQTVRQIVMNRTYIGEKVQNKWNTEGMLGNEHRPEEEKVRMKLRDPEEWIIAQCPVIIEREQFEYAQKIITESKRRWAKRGLRNYLLSSILRCGICGNTMCGTRSTNWGKEVFVYTCSKNTVGAKNKGCGRRINISNLDDNVWNTVHHWLNQPDEIASSLSEIQTSNKKEENEIIVLEKEVEKARSARKRLLKLFAIVDEDNDLGEEEIRQELRDWKEKEDKITEQILFLKKQIEFSKEQSYNENILREAVDYYLSKNPDELTLDDKQHLVRMVVREIVVYENSIDILTF